MLLLNSESHLFSTTGFYLDTSLFDVDTERCAQLRHHLTENLANASFAEVQDLADFAQGTFFMILKRHD
jgi:hypothetical protein